MSLAPDQFDAAYESALARDAPQQGGSFGELVVFATELGSAVSRGRLSAAERARILERAFAIVDAHAPRGWRARVLDHRRSAVVGGAALMTLAAVGVAVVVERRHHVVGVAA